jgi:hypothetical protein
MLCIFFISHVFTHNLAFHSAFKSKFQVYFKFKSLAHLSSLNITAHEFLSHRITFDFAKTIADFGLIAFPSSNTFKLTVSIVLVHIFTYKVVFHVFLPVIVISLFQSVKL